MPLTSRYSDYDKFAWIYNRHWGERFLPMALLALEKLALDYIPAGANVLDLCCGTGQLAMDLTALGYRVTGIDGSSEMLSFARENAPGVKLILEDARTFSLPESFHLVDCMFDSLNHVMSLKGLAAVFRNVHAALLKGGLFIFDLNTEESYVNNWNGYYGVVEEDHVCIIRNSYDAARHIAKFEGTIFRLDQYWQRSELVLLQKCHPVTKVVQALQTAGFKDVAVYCYDENKGFIDISATARRAFYVCRKE
jgi:SAM-dependent methyltransferase